MSKILNLFATSPKGLEGLLFEEIKTLGGSEPKETPGGVHFQADLTGAYRVCLWSRLANHVLLPLARFPATDADTLYRGTQGIEWDTHFGIEQTMAVNFASRNSALNHSQFGAQKVKDAIVDQFRDRCGERPSVSLNDADIHINCFIDRDYATVSLDLSGQSLHRRGYREQAVEAPLKENLAAALLIRAGWPKIAAEGGALVDPCCGSGTLPIEAALIAADSAPGLQRRDFGFLHWRQHDAASWLWLTQEAKQRREQGLLRLTPIVGSDFNRKAVAIARDNVQRAGLSDVIEIQHHDLTAARPPAGGNKGLVICNPPYGERLGDRETLPGLYEKLGETLRTQFDGWQAAVLTNDMELGKHLGLGARHRYRFYNGALDCKLLCIDINSAAHRHRPNDTMQPLNAEQRSESAQMFGNRLHKNYKRLARWAQNNDIHCYRVYDADLPEYSMAIDIYTGEKHDSGQRWVHIQEYAAPKTIEPIVAQRRFREACAVTLSELAIPATQLFSKQRSQQKGTAQYQKHGEHEEFHIVKEGDLQFYVNFTDYLDTGLFLDHRPVRGWIRDLAKGKRVLNLFAYTGAASVYAAAGGAKQVVSVDMSRTYMDWAKRNFGLNKFDIKAHEFIQADCLDWLKQTDDKTKFDLIFLDPPSFSNSKRMDTTLDIQRDHVALIEATLAHLSRDGILLFSTNLRRFILSDEIRNTYEVEDRTATSIPEDFARNQRIHQCWSIRRK